MTIKIGTMHEYMYTANDMMIHPHVLSGDQNRAVHVTHDGQSVYDRYLIMIEDIKELKRLNMTMHKELLVDLILQFLFSLYR